MKAESFTFYVAQTVKFSRAQMEKIYRAWLDKWNLDKNVWPPSTMPAEDALQVADLLGFVELPEDWKP